MVHPNRDKSDLEELLKKNEQKKSELPFFEIFAYKRVLDNQTEQLMNKIKEQQELMNSKGLSKRLVE